MNRQLLPKILFGLTLLLPGALVHANEGKTRTQSLSLNLVSIVFGGAELQYEFQLTDYLRLTFPLDVKILDFTLFPKEVVYGSRLFGWGLLPNFSIATGMGAKFIYAGWYVEPAMTLGYARLVYPTPSQVKQAAMFQPKLSIGYQAIFDFGLVLDVGIGVEGRYFVPAPDAVLLTIPLFNVYAGYAF